ncbi:MAG TPA: GWxTD domain-containing protein [Gemmatimonadales bacterium]
MQAPSFTTGVPIVFQGCIIWPRSAGPLLALLLLSTGASAQTAEQRRAIDAFRDSLAVATDTVQLHAQERTLLEQIRRTRRDPFLHLRLGHLSLRQGELGGDSHFDDAASEFKYAGELAPHFPYAWFGLGQAEFALGSRLSGTTRPLARDALSRAGLAFARAVTLEPGFAPRLEEMARRAIRAQAPERAEVIREALRRAAREARPPHLARLLLALGRTQRELGDSGALASFGAYLAATDNRALGQVEIGRTLLLHGDLRGQVVYLEGASSDDPITVAEVRADLAPLAGEAELADSDLRRGDARADMLRKFWSMRDRLELRAEGERLAEHLRRLAVARREFLLTGEDGTERLDDRGRVFVRHGEPDDRASFAIPGVAPNESWRYRRAGEDLVVHFTARQTPNDYRLIESVLDVSDIRATLGGSQGQSAPAAGGVNGEQLLRSRAGLASLYEQLPAGRPEQIADYFVRERALGRHGIQMATGSDSYRPRYRLDLNAWGSVVVAGGSGARPVVQVLFAIPGYAVEPATGAAGVVYPVRVRFVALDSAGTVVASVDTVTRIEPGERIPANRSLVGHVTIPVLPGKLLAQAAVQYGDLGGTAFGVDLVEVPSPGVGQLALGDLLIGSRRGRLILPLGDGSRMAISPGGVVRQSDGLDLAVEVFGLAPGAEAAIQVSVAPEDDAPAESGEYRWRPYPSGWSESKLSRAPGTAPITRWRVTLPLARFKAGSWKLAVVVTDSAGRMARRESGFTVEMP